MFAVRIPTDWTPLEANAAITLIEAMLDALWRQYPEPLEQYFYEQLDDDGYPVQDPPDPSIDTSTTEDQEDDEGFLSDEIPF